MKCIGKAFLAMGCFCLLVSDKDKEMGNELKILLGLYKLKAWRGSKFVLTG
jgi:hypothetical protein